LAKLASSNKLNMPHHFDCCVLWCHTLSTLSTKTYKMPVQRCHSKATAHESSTASNTFTGPQADYKDSGVANNGQSS
jgi:hypothetical protein